MQNLIVRKLTQERINELRQQLEDEQKACTDLHSILAELSDDSITDERLAKLHQQMQAMQQRETQEDEEHRDWLKRREQQYAAMTKQKVFTPGGRPRQDTATSTGSSTPGTPVPTSSAASSIEMHLAGHPLSQQQQQQKTQSQASSNDPSTAAHPGNFASQLPSASGFVRGSSPTAVKNEEDINQSTTQALFSQESPSNSIESQTTHAERSAHSPSTNRMSASVELSSMSPTRPGTKVTDSDKSLSQNADTMQQQSLEYQQDSTVDKIHGSPAATSGESASLRAKDAEAKAALQAEKTIIKIQTNVFESHEYSLVNQSEESNEAASHMISEDTQSCSDSNHAISEKDVNKNESESSFAGAGKEHTDRSLAGRDTDTYEGRLSSDGSKRSKRDRFSSSGSGAPPTRRSGRVKALRPPEQEQAERQSRPDSGDLLGSQQGPPSVGQAAAQVLSRDERRAGHNEETNDSTTSESELQIGRAGPPSRALSLVESVPNSPASGHQDDADQLKEYRTWKKAIMPLMKQAATHKYSSLFLSPVTDEEAKGYSDVVHRPIDLTQIKKKLENGAIRTTSEFQRDMMLMFQNAIMYNNAKHEVHLMALEMQKEVLEAIEDFIETQASVSGSNLTTTDKPAGSERNRVCYSANFIN